MGYKLTNTTPLYRDRQDEPPLAFCPECLGEIYRGDLYVRSGAALYHTDCCERMIENGDRGYLPAGKG